jgi:hypothetical protein
MATIRRVNRLLRPKATYRPFLMGDTKRLTGSVSHVRESHEAKVAVRPPGHSTAETRTVSEPRSVGSGLRTTR